MTAPYRLLPATPLTTLAMSPRAGQGLARARELGPEGTIELIRAAGLRGRGGAGFPTAVKWGNLAQDPSPVKYLVCNAAEGEPGTFKDRTLIRLDPYVLLEGVAIAALAIGATAAYIGMKETFVREHERLTAALAEMQAAHLLGDVPIHLATGPDEYLLGEERGLLEAIEGNFPYPRVSPPYVHGLFAPQGMFSAETGANHPTVVNNVETLSHAARILRDGLEVFRAVGTEATPGTGIFTLLGDVTRPGVYELPLGTTFRTLLEEHGGGMKDGAEFKLMLSGVSSGALTAEHLDTPLDFAPMKAAGSGLGSGGYIVYDARTSAVELAELYSHFLANESCGQCPSCKTGTARLTETLEKLSYGYATRVDLFDLDQTLEQVATGNRCYLPVAEQTLLRSLYTLFSSEFVDALSGQGLPRRELELPKLKDHDPVAHSFTYDPYYRYKRPDGGYNPPAEGMYHFWLVEPRPARGS